MRLYCKDPELKEVSEGKLPKGFDPVMAKKIKKVTDFIDASNDERDLRAYRALHFEKLSGIRIVGTGYRIVFKLANNELKEAFLDNYHD